MGAWGAGNFDNDTACDWAYDLEKSTDLSVIERSIHAVFDDEDYVDADIASEALAAIETLARLQGNFGVKDAYTETVDKWVAANPQDIPTELLDKAFQAIELIVHTEKSELYELWDEDDASEWLAEVNALKSRLNK